MRIKEMDLEQLLWLRDTSEEALTSEMFKNDRRYYELHLEVDEKISLDKIKIVNF